MRFLKTIFLTVFIGFYFLSITPMHFYTHSFDHQDSQTKALDDCSYVNLLNFGQGSFLNSGIIDFISTDFLEFQSIEQVELSSNFILNYLSFHFNLRAPPSLNF